MILVEVFFDWLHLSTRCALFYDDVLRYSGLPGGEENGMRGYMLTFVIAYLRVSVCDLFLLVCVCVIAHLQVSQVSACVITHLNVSVRVSARDRIPQGECVCVCVCVVTYHRVIVLCFVDSIVKLNSGAQQ